jgi:hypothetical protein
VIWIWALIAVLVAAAGMRHRARIAHVEDAPEGLPRVDDDAIRRILREGSLRSPDDEPVDMEEAARAEEEFFDESWDEPEEYRP